MRGRKRDIVCTCAKKLQKSGTYMINPGKSYRLWELTSLCSSNSLCNNEFNSHASMVVPYSADQINSNILAATTKTDKTTPCTHQLPAPEDMDYHYGYICLLQQQPQKNVRDYSKFLPPTLHHCIPDCVRGLWGSGTNHNKRRSLQQRRCC